MLSYRSSWVTFEEAADSASRAVQETGTSSDSAVLAIEDAEAWEFDLVLFICFYAFSVGFGIP